MTVASRHSTAAITYIVTIPQETAADISPFQGFSYSTLGLTPVLHAMVGWPTGLYEPLLDRQKLLFSRLKGTSALQIEILQVNVLTADCVQTFTVFVSVPETVEDTHRFVGTCGYPVLHVTAGKHPDVPHYSTVTPAMLYEHCLRVIRTVRERGGTIVTPPLPDGMPPGEPQQVSFNVYSHNVTLPNELAVRSLGLVGVPAACPIEQFKTHITPEPDVVNAPYKRLILESAAGIRTLRREIADRDDLFGAVDLILTAPSVLAELSGRQMAAGAKALDCDPATFRLVLEQLLKQRQYPQFLIGADQAQTMLSSVQARLAASVRKWELDFYTAIVGVRASGYFCPALRLPPSVNLLRGRLADIGSSARATSGRRRDKLSRLAQDIGAELARVIGPEMLAFIAATEANIKILSDAPLELLSVGGLPLSVRYSTSRVTTTPGNLFASQLLTSRVELVEPTDLLKVLVVRSFDEGDKRKQHLERMIARYVEPARDAGLDITWADIHSTDDLVAALKTFSGYILVYDGHGSYSAEHGNGTLRIGGQDIDVWSLRYRTRVPPIVILSACDTLAIDGTHASTANGLLMLGAVTVLATLAPVNSLHSAAFVGRLMLRLAAYVKDLPGLDVLPLRWSEILSGLIKMNYLTDLLRALKTKKVILDKHAWLKVTRQSTAWINSLDRSWPEKTFQLLGSITGQSPDEIAAAAKEVAYFTESLKYVQLGNPEEIVIVDPTWRQKAEESRAKPFA